MADYRWNKAELAAGYDAAAPRVHPYYRELQDQVLAAIPYEPSESFRLLDLGGGSGRLVERVLETFPFAEATVLDQSEPFLSLAGGRLARFAPRGRLIPARLQDDWGTQLPAPANVIVSMSAIHHLEPAEKQDLYRRCHAALAPGGVFLNGDEVRDVDDGVYLEQLRTWGAHMRQLIAGGSVSAPMAEALTAWQARNIDGFDQPRRSGDDCHEPVETQLDYLLAAGFAWASCPWRKDMWALLGAMKPLDERRPVGNDG